MRKLTQLLAAALSVLGVAFFVATSAPADAASTAATPAAATCVHHGNDFGCSKDGDGGISACDYEPDGHLVYTEAQVYGTGSARVVDRNGTGAGCDSRSLTPHSYNVIRVCEMTSGPTDSCTDWVRV